MKRRFVPLRILLLCTMVLSNILFLTTANNTAAQAYTAPPDKTGAPALPSVTQTTPPLVPPTPQQVTTSDGRTFTTMLPPTQDTYVHSAYPSTNYGSNGNLLARLEVAPVSQAYTLLHFDLTGLPENTVILTATLELYSEVNQAQAPTSISIAPNSVDSDWDEMTVTWNNKPSTTYRGDAEAEYVSPGWTEWNVTSIISGWVAGTFPNYGIMLNVTNQGTAIWLARQSTNYPRLTITYRTAGSPMILPVGMDTWVNEAQPSTNYAEGSYLRTRYDGFGNGNRGYILLWFDMSYLPPDTNVLTATLELYSQINRTQATAPDQPSFGENIFPDAVHNDWNEATVTWNNKPVAYSEGDPPSPYQLGWMQWDVTASARGWVSGTLSNYGIQLRIYDPDPVMVDFLASPGGFTPRLTVYYEPLPPVCDPVTSVRISGPTTGNTGTDYGFEAAVAPYDATGPFTYTWTATNHTHPVTVVTSDTTNVMTYTWATAGDKTVAVTVENCGGTASDTHQVTIQTPPPSCTDPLTELGFHGPSQGVVGDGYSFDATAHPKAATTPITFTWQAEGQSPVTTAGTKLQSTQVYTWSTLGPKAITVTASNCGGTSTFVHYHTMDIVEPSELPDLDVTTAWYDTDNQRIGFLVKNIGGSTAPAGHVDTLHQGSSVPDETIAFPYDLQPGAIREAYFDVARTCATPSEPVQICADTVGNKVIEGDESNNCWSLTWPCDMDPPLITSGPTVVTTTETTATIAWQTNEPCDSEIKYGQSSYTYPHAQSDGTLITHHEMVVTGLDSASVYHFYVLATDGGDTTVNSDEAFFETQPPGFDPPVITNLEVVTYTNPHYDLYSILTSVDDVAGLDRIEFYYDGTLIKTEYFYPGHALNAADVFSPYALGYPRDAFFGHGHTVSVKAINTNGQVAVQLKPHNPGALPDQPVDLDMLTPGDNQTLYVTQDPAPTGTTLDVTVQAAEFEWGCTYTSFSEGLPASVQAVDCDDVDSSVVAIGVYLGNVLVSSYLPGSDDFEHTFHLDLSGKSAGVYTVAVAATLSDGSTSSVQRTINLEVGSTALSLERTVTRVDNYFEVELTLANDASATVDAEVSQLWDNVSGFQVINKSTQPGLLAPIAASGYYTVDQYTIVSSSPSRMVRIDFFNGNDSFITLAPGEDYTINYIMLPELHETVIDYDIGDDGTFVHTTLDSQTLYAPSGNLNGEVADAFKQSDYLIVTNPDQLMYHYGTSAPVKALLSEMARLAQIKRGALGYLDSYNDKQVLDNLVEPNGYWATSMYDDFKSVRKGYMLIVGETEIVGAWDYTGLDLSWDDANYVHLSDHEYAQTRGGGAPDLIVGRVIGNDPVELRHALRTSVNMTVGAWQMDRSNALLVSGRGHGVGDFINNVNEVGNDLTADGWNVTKLHWRDYRFLSSFAQDFDQYDGFAAGDVIAGGKAEMVIAKRSGDHFYILDAEGNLVGTFDHSFDEGDGLAVGDVIGDDAAEIIVGAASNGNIYIYAANGAELGHFSCGFSAFDGLATGYATYAGDKDQIIFGDAAANTVTVYNESGFSLFSFSAPFDAHDGLAAGNVMTGTYETTLDEIIIGHDDVIYIYDDTDGSLNTSFTVNHTFRAGDRLASGDVNAYYFPGPYPEPADEIVIGDMNDYVYIYNWHGHQLSRDHVGDFDAYDGLAVADVSGNNEEDVLMADRSDYIHLVDAHYPRWATEAFKNNVAGQDVIFYRGHGGASEWHAMKVGDFPLDFDNTKPFVFAPTCLSGNYELHNDNGIAEAFLNNNAAVYIGSTQVSSHNDNSPMATRFFDNWGADESIGSALTQIERQMWDANDWGTDWWEFWVYEYNLYGDPKIGTDGTVLPTLGPAAALVPAAPAAAHTFHVPMYQITTVDGNDQVHIPGGSNLIAQDHYAVPYWSETIIYRPGTVVQDVTMTDRSGLTVTTGVSMPLTAIYTDSLSYAAPRAAPAGTAEDAWFPQLDAPYRWYSSEDEDGSVVLTIEMYPFFYNPATQDVRFYQDFTFDVQAISTDLSIQAIDTDQNTYVQGAPVSVTLAISNAGSAQDVIVAATIKTYPDTAVAGLPLRTLHNLNGLSTASFAWDSSGVPAGEYFVEIKLLNTTGDVLDLEMQEFTLGITDGEVTALTATPETFTAGDNIAIAMTFENTGTVPITGTAVVQVYPADVVTATATFTHAVTGLAPSGSIVFHDLWDTAGAAADAYRIVAYVKYNSSTSAPVEVIVTQATDYEVFLPLVIRNR